MICAVRAFDHAWSVSDARQADFDRVLHTTESRVLAWLAKGPRDVEELRHVAAATEE